MKKTSKHTLLFLLYIGVFIAVFLFLQSGGVLVLEPKGLIAAKERKLIIIATLIMLTVVIPVFFLTFYIAWKYRAENKKAKYMPDWDYNFAIEALWWGIPFLIIIYLSALTWTSTHDLDPFKPLKSDVKPLKVQVVALQWKWLFIYPEQKIATVNYLKVPIHTPINFDVTADAPMNSFWIPQLGGQIYAMPGMKTKLHLIANEIGCYRGVSANLSGKGFSGMKFTTEATSQEDFDTWVEKMKGEPQALTRKLYNLIAAPSENNPPSSFTLKDEDLYEQIVMKYMMQTG